MRCTGGVHSERRVAPQLHRHVHSDRINDQCARSLLRLPTFNLIILPGFPQARVWPKNTDICSAAAAYVDSCLAPHVSTSIPLCNPPACRICSGKHRHCAACAAQSCSTLM